MHSLVEDSGPCPKAPANPDLPRAKVRLPQPRAKGGKASTASGANGYPVDVPVTTAKSSGASVGPASSITTAEASVSNGCKASSISTAEAYGATAKPVGHESLKSGSPLVVGICSGLGRKACNVWFKSGCPLMFFSAGDCFKCCPVRTWSFGCEGICSCSTRTKLFFVYLVLRMADVSRSGLKHTCNRISFQLS